VCHTRISFIYKKFNLSNTSSIAQHLWKQGFILIKNEMLPRWVQWRAQDADGAWWGYECEPLQNETGWYENEVGRIVKLEHGVPNDSWQDSLLSVRRAKHP